MLLLPTVLQTQRIWLLTGADDKTVISLGTLFLFVVIQPSGIFNKIICLKVSKGITEDRDRLPERRRSMLDMPQPPEY